MEMISAGQQNGQVIQLGFFESVAGLLFVRQGFLCPMISRRWYENNETPGKEAYCSPFSGVQCVHLQNWFKASG